MLNLFNISLLKFKSSFNYFPLINQIKLEKKIVVGYQWDLSNLIMCYFEIAVAKSSNFFVIVLIVFIYQLKLMEKYVSLDRFSS